MLLTAQGIVKSMTEQPVFRIRPYPPTHMDQSSVSQAINATKKLCKALASPIANFICQPI